ncbi:hypothetical protein ACIBTV_27495 [Micromonospora sp. NPDC049366]|uniref:hypothetical protein n=1 Tax=Micromonospora sp. NPDC049366 TaxID=3364271 RepID=UPI0037AA7D08
MAASATAKPPADSARVGRPEIRVEQPPRTITIGGERVDVSHLTGDALYEAITQDEEQWDYPRLSAETGRSITRLRKWVMNAYAVEREPSKAPDDKTFIAPEGRTGGISPWWKGGKAREVLIQIGVMTREGVAIPHKPTGRTPGARDTAPRRRWETAPVRDTGLAVYREYLELTTRKRDPLNDRQARAELSRRHNLSRTQLARRINAGREQHAAKSGQTTAVEVDVPALRARLAELVAEQRAAGYSERGADSRARDALAAETKLTRRQLAGYLTAAAAAGEQSG